MDEAASRAVRERDSFEVGGGPRGVDENYVFEMGGEIRDDGEGRVVGEGEAAVGTGSEVGDGLGTAAVAGDESRAAVEAREPGGALARPRVESVGGDGKDNPRRSRRAPRSSRWMMSLRFGPRAANPRRCRGA